MYRYLRLIRPETGTMLTVKSPIELNDGLMEESIALHLNSYVNCKFPGFDICDFWTDDQKKMMETA